MNYIYLILPVVAVLLIFLIILILKESKLKEEIEKIPKKEDYLEELGKITSSKKAPEEKIKEMSYFIKRIFNEKFSIPKNIDYLEIQERFEKKDQKDYVNFCQKMIEIIYSGEKITSKKIEKIEKEISEIIDKEFEGEEDLEKKGFVNKKEDNSLYFPQIKRRIENTCHDKLREINKIIDKGHELIDFGQTEKAKEKYHEIIKIYHNLEHKNHELYEKIKALYTRIINKEN